MKVLVFDIEAVRDPSVWTPPVEQPEKFAPPYAWVPIVIGGVLLDGDSGGFCTTKIRAIVGPEGEMLSTFRSIMEKPPLLVTWNGRHYDLPVLMARSMKHGIPSPWYYQARDMRYRYSEAGHCDLADAIADYGAADRPNLDGMAKLIGLPGKFGAVDGAGVAQAFAEGRLDEIAGYCMADAVQTAFLWLRWETLKGSLSLPAYRASALALLTACPSVHPLLAELADRADRETLLLPASP